MKVRVEDKEIDGKNGSDVRLHLGPIYMAECLVAETRAISRSMVISRLQESPQWHNIYTLQTDHSHQQQKHTLLSVYIFICMA